MAWIPHRKKKKEKEKEKEKGERKEKGGRSKEQGGGEEGNMQVKLEIKGNIIIDTTN